MRKLVNVLLSIGASIGILKMHYSKGTSFFVLCFTLLCFVLILIRCNLYEHDLETICKSNNADNKTYSLLGKELLQRINEREIKLKEEYTANINDRQFRINALQNQINPHFLYNTLECIRSEAIIQNCNSIASMSHAMASFFRYSISRRENIVTIRDELNNIKNYFAIQKFRFEDRFSLNIELEEDSLQECLLPKMTIQPIVENSIFHGLEPKVDGGKVDIKIRSTESLLDIIISDDGVGMDDLTLNKMKMNMEKEGIRPNNSKSGEHGNGIAVHNVHQRIKLIFGSEYGVQIYSSKDIGTQVEIIIPIIHNRSEISTVKGSEL